MKNFNSVLFFLMMGLSGLLCFNFQESNSNFHIDIRNEFINEPKYLKQQDIQLFDKIFNQMGLPQWLYPNLIRMINFKKIKFDNLIKNNKKSKMTSSWKYNFFTGNNLESYESEEEYFLIEQINQKVKKLIQATHRVPTTLMDDQALNKALDIAIYAKEKGVSLLEAYFVNKTLTNEFRISPDNEKLVQDICEMIKYNSHIFPMFKKLIKFMTDSKKENISPYMTKAIYDLHETLTLQNLVKNKRFSNMFSILVDSLDKYENIIKNSNDQDSWVTQSTDISEWDFSKIPSNILNMENPLEFNKILNTMKKLMTYNFLGIDYDKSLSLFKSEELPNFFLTALKLKNTAVTFSRNEIPVPELIDSKMLPYTNLQKEISDPNSTYEHLRSKLTELDSFYFCMENEHEYQHRNIENDFSHDDIKHFLSIFDNKMLDDKGKLREAFVTLKNNSMASFTTPIITSIDSNSTKVENRKLTTDELIEDDLMTNDLVSSNPPNQKFIDIEKVVSPYKQKRSQLNGWNVPFVN